MRARQFFAGLLTALALATAPGTVVVLAPPGLENLGPAARARVEYWNGGYQRWNEIARDLIGLKGLTPPRAARIYAALSVAQWLASMR